MLNWSAKAQLYGSPAATIAGMGGHTVWWQHQIPEGHWVDRIATLLPTLAVGCSSSASQKAQASLSPRRRSFVVNPGIEAVKGRNGNGADLRDELGIPAGRLVVGIVGRPPHGKEQDRFFAAVYSLRFLAIATPPSHLNA